MQLKQSTARVRKILMVQMADHITGLTGATVTVTLSKAGATTFGALGGTVAEVANGFYNISLNTTDTNTVGDLAFHCTAAGGDPTDFIDEVTVLVAGDQMTAATTRTALGMASANLDTQLAGIDTDVLTRLATAGYTAPPTAVANADALLIRNIAGGSNGTRTVQDALRFLRNKWSIAAGALTVCQEDDTTPAWTAVVSSSAGAVPIIGNDPA